MRRWQVLLGLLLALSICVSADTLKLLDGKVVSGTFLGGDARTIRMEVASKIEVFAISDVESLSFGHMGVAEQPGLDPKKAREKAKADEKARKKANEEAKKAAKEAEKAAKAAAKAQEAADKANKLAAATAPAPAPVAAPKAPDVQAPSKPKFGGLGRPSGGAYQAASTASTAAGAASAAPGAVGQGAQTAGKAVETANTAASTAQQASAVIADPKAAANGAANSAADSATSSAVNRATGAAAPAGTTASTAANATNAAAAGARRASTTSQAVRSPDPSTQSPQPVRTAAPESAPAASATPAQSASATSQPKTVAEPAPTPQPSPAPLAASAEPAGVSQQEHVFRVRMIETIDSAVHNPGETFRSILEQPFKGDGGNIDAPKGADVMLRLLKREPGAPDGVAGYTLEAVSVRVNYRNRAISGMLMLQPGDALAANQSIGKLQLFKGSSSLKIQPDALLTFVVTSYPLEH